MSLIGANYHGEWVHYYDISPEGEHYFKVNELGISTKEPKRETVYYYKNSHAYAWLIICFHTPVYTFFNGSPRFTPAHSFFILRKNELQHYTTDRGDQLHFSWCHFYGESVEEVFESSALTPGMIYTMEDSETFMHYLNLLWRECTHYKVQDEKIIKGIFEIWLRDLERAIAEKSIQTKIPHFLMRAKNFIFNNYQKPISLEDIARYSKVSPFHLSREFSALFGEPPITFLINHRLAHAKHLVEYSDSPMTEVALECGYPDPFYFSKAFKKRYCISPLKMRKQTQSK